jgi:hypothetical protein
VRKIGGALEGDEGEGEVGVGVGVGGEVDEGSWR